MKLKIFTVYDSKAEAFLQPFFIKSKGHAIRAFQELTNDKTHQFGKYPADYTLFEIGEYDEEKGTIETYQAKTNYGTGLELKSDTSNISQVDDIRPSSN